jgi:large subunit ribosomal protein L25
MEKITLAVDQRQQSGKGPSRRLRASGKIPAVFYGKKTEPLKLAIDLHEFRKQYEHTGSNPLFELRIQGDKVPKRTAILKQRQINPVNSTLVHLDFVEVFMDEELQVTVPLEFQGKPAGADVGGSFQTAVKELLVSCLPDRIPSVIAVDISGLAIGSTLHVKDIPLPDGVKFAQDENLAIATVLAPKAEEEAEVAEAPEAETTS